MKQDVNYIKHHKCVNAKMLDDDLSAIDISIYNALFLVWNNAEFDSCLSINRNDIMKLGKVGNANTYTSSLRRLDEKGYIKYNPSHSPLKGSLVTMCRFDKSSDKGSALSSGLSSGKSSDTLYKLNKLLNLSNYKNLETLVAFFEGATEEEADFYYKILVSEKKKKEKVAPKEKDKPVETTEHWKIFTDLWFAFYKSKKDFDPTFEGKESAALKSIAKKLKQQSEIKGTLTWDAEYVKRLFEHFLTKAYADKWRKENFMLHILNSHFDAIIQTDETRTNNNTKQTGGNVDTGALLRGLSQFSD